MSTQPIPAFWSDDEPDDTPRHACWLLTFADGTEQHVGCWPPMSRLEILAAYRCIDAKADF